METKFVTLGDEIRFQVTSVTLDEWLTEQNMTNEAFADRLGVSKVSVGRYRHGRAMPRTEIAARIVTETDGKVQVADLHEAALRNMAERVAA